jgi:hypothetical protein
MSEKVVSPTVYGIETEYSLLLNFPDDVVYEIVGECHSADAKLGLYKEPAKAGGRQIDKDEISKAVESLGIRSTSSGMLSNGGRFYVDPSGPEYATPETTTAEEVVHRTFEGDRILTGVLDYLRKEDIIEVYQANRRIVDHNRTSRGIHLNTTTLIDDESHSRIYKRLALLNVAKGAIFGSGGLLVEEDGSTAFHHSPRLSLTDCVSAPYPEYDKRPLVRKPFKQEGYGLRRIETVAGDALNFGWPLRASLVATNALVKLVELKRDLELPVITHAVDVARHVGRYGNSEKITILDASCTERNVYPLDVMRGICETILSADEEESFLDDESRQVIPEIIAVADSMSIDIDSVVRQVESVARLRAIEHRIEQSPKLRLTLDSEKICKLDYYWDLINGGLAEKLRNKMKSVGWQGFDSTVSVNDSSLRLRTPPQDTRARLRGEAILDSGPTNGSGWSTIDFDDELLYIPPVINASFHCKQ